MKTSVRKRSVLALGVTATLSLAALSFTTPATAQDAAAVARGQEVFTRQCAPCHGADRGDFGRAMLPGTDALRIKYKGAVPALLTERKDLTPALIKTFVRKGTFSMPPFRKSELSDAQIDDISAYLSVTAKAPR